MCSTLCTHLCLTISGFRESTLSSNRNPKGFPSNCTRWKHSSNGVYRIDTTHFENEHEQRSRRSRIPFHPLSGIRETRIKIAIPRRPDERNGYGNRNRTVRTEFEPLTAVTSASPKNKFATAAEHEKFRENGFTK